MIESCIGYLGADIKPNCDNMQKMEFTGEGVIVDLNDNSGTVIEASGAEPDVRMITNINAQKADQNPGTAYIVDNLMRNPFSGANHALNTENGRSSYDFSLPIRIPNVSAEMAKLVVEPLANSRFLGVFPTTNGKYLVYGAYGRWNASEITWNPSENGSDAVATMTDNEPYFMVECTKEVYDNLLSLAQQ